MRWQSDRRGWVLPLVLLCGMVLALGLFFFQFVTSTDASQVRRLMKLTQAAALADAASDELHAQLWLLQPAAADAKRALPPWAGELLARLDDARSAARGTTASGLDVRLAVDVRAQLTATLESAARAGETLALSSAILRLGPFRSVPGAYDARLFYAEPAFADAAKDPVPWDLRGPITLEISIRTERGPFVFDQRFVRTTELALTDTTPPAAEFALFNYLPPPDEDYALNDLQRGGRLTVFPMDAGRVMVRGPLLLAAEDAPKEKPHLGGRQRPADALNYPAPEARQWTGWSTVPGPRALQYPAGDAIRQVKQGVESILELFRVDPLFSDLGPRRPRTDKSPTSGFGPLGPFDTGPFKVGPFGPWDFDLSFLIAVGVERLASIYLPLNDDEVSTFSPGAYYFGPLESGKQTFSILGSTHFVPKTAGQPTSASMYRGVRVPATPGQPGAPYTGGLNGLTGLTGTEAEAILPEPVPRLAGQTLVDTGLVGYYRIAMFDATTFFSVSALELFGPLLCSLVTGPLGGATCKAITTWISYLGLDASPRFMVRYHETQTPGELPARFDFAGVEKALAEDQAMVVPYGLFMHTDDFWSGANFKKAFKEWMFNTIANDIFKFGADKLVKVLGNLIKGMTSKAAVEAAESETGVAAREALELSAVVLKEVEEASAGILRLIADSFTGQYFAKLALNRLKPLVTDPIKGLINLVFSTYPPDRPHHSAVAEAFAAVGRDTASLVAEYPQGLFPPKHREWERIVTRSFPDLPTYLASDTRDGVLELRGAVLIRKLAHRGGPIRYRGRGILVAVTEDATAPATLDAVVEPAEPAGDSHLILAHRVLESAAAGGRLPSLLLGQKFAGTVYSDTGVAPASQATLVEGNLVTGLLNKRGIPGALTGPTEGVFVRYSPQLAKAVEGPRANYWSLDLIGDVTSTDLERK